MAGKSSAVRSCYKFASRCLYGGWVLCTCVIASMIATLLILRLENRSYTITTTIAASKLIRRYSPYVTRAQYVKNRPLEAVDVEYDRNIFFTVKTTASNYQERLSTLILTWFQTVHRDDITIISDDITSGKSYNNAIKEAGFHLITTNCPHTHVRKALCCKSGEEFHSYYKAVRNNKSSYHWFCHVDDDVYVNVPQLSRLLQKYDPRQPHYIGRWVHEDPSINVTVEGHTTVFQGSLHSFY